MATISAKTTIELLEKAERTVCPLSMCSTGDTKMCDSENCFAFTIDVKHNSSGQEYFLGTCGMVTGEILKDISITLEEMSGEIKYISNKV